jgi:hypothetical protein
MSKARSHRVHGMDKITMLGQQGMGRCMKTHPLPHLGQFLLGRIANVEHFALDFGLDPIC